MRVTAGDRPLRVVTTAPDGTFAFTAPAAAGATFRLELERDGRWSAVGLPTRVR